LLTRQAVIAAKRIEVAIAARHRDPALRLPRGSAPDSGDFENETFSPSRRSRPRADPAQERAAPAILIGPASAVLRSSPAAADVPEATAVGTIAASVRSRHVTGLFRAHTTHPQPGDSPVSRLVGPSPSSAEFSTGRAEETLLEKIRILQRRCW